MRNFALDLEKHIEVAYCCAFELKLKIRIFHISTIPLLGSDKMGWTPGVQQLIWSEVEDGHLFEMVQHAVSRKFFKRARVVADVAQ